MKLNKKFKVICIIQARVSSTRLPQKALKDIHGKTCIQRVIERVKKSQLLDEIWLATTKMKVDIVFKKICEANKVKFFQGSVNNVLSRYFNIVKISNADYIVRITGDCPFVDAGIIDKAVKLIKIKKCDYLSNTIDRTYPDGIDVEVFSNSALNKAYKEAKHPFLKEHVTPYIHGQVPEGINSGTFKVEKFSSKVNYERYRLTLDRQADLDLIRRIYSQLSDHCSWKEVINHIEKHSSLKKINNHIKTNEGSLIGLKLSTKNNKKKNRYKNSILLFKKALKFIPTGSQTFSKSYLQWPLYSSPLFLKEGKGCIITDVDNNKYIDYLLALLPIIIGYANKEVDQAVYAQARKGTILSLSHPKEIELSEKLVNIIPYAEMVKFSKNGSDVLSAAVRLARAFTNRDLVAVSGYHGWHDWYVGTTSRKAGVPNAISRLTKKFIFNDIESLVKILEKAPQKFAAIVLEPDTFEKPNISFLKEVRRLCDLHGIILIYDEIICGFRTMLGGASKKYGVLPDLGCFGKAMANGYPLAALVGKRNIMKKLEEAFISGTFSGELLSIQACLTTIKIIERDNVIKKLEKLGKSLKNKLNKVLKDDNLEKEISFEGNDWWPRLSIKETEIGKDTFSSLLRQELLSNGLFLGASLNLCHSHCSDTIQRQTLKKFKTAINIFKQKKSSVNPEKYLNGKKIESVFKVR
tara:strand:- start:219 stop:2297 length:2079 start_codon:yes stop_codon:yes gene_type:complete